MYDQAEKAYDESPQYATSSDVRQTHVESALGAQPELISSIQQAISELDKRLSGVLRNVDDAEKMAGEPRPVLVPIAEKLHDNNDSLRGVHRRLVSILDRLEL